MKKLVLLFLINFLFSVVAFSQDVYQMGQTLDFFRNLKMVEENLKPGLTENDIKGSPFLNDDFIPGTVYTTSKTKYAEIPLRLNVFNDEIEFKVDERIQALAAPEVIEKIEFGEYTIHYVPFVVSKKINRGFLILLVEGKASLYSKPEVSFIKATEPAPYQEAEPAKFVKKADSYFIRIGKAEARLVSNKKNLMDAFGEFQEELETFFKKNKIKINNPESLKELVNYYNTL